MDTVLQVNWEPILWLAGGLITFFFTVITGLLTWIGYMNKQAAKTLEARMNKQDEHEGIQDQRLLIHDNEIHNIALSNREILTVMKHKFKIK